MEKHTVESLSTLTVAILNSIAKDMKISLEPKAKKAGIISAILDKQGHLGEAPKGELLADPPAEVILDTTPVTPATDEDDVEDEPEVPTPAPKVDVSTLGTPAILPTGEPADPMVVCGVCGRSVPQSTTFSLPSGNTLDGPKYYCKKDPACRKPAGKPVDLKTQAQVATARAAAKHKAKTPKTTKGPNLNIGKFDDCLLTALENKRASATSVRSQVYSYITEHPQTTIKAIVEAGVATLPVVRDCVKKLFADLKISIEGWRVVTPRTLNFEKVEAETEAPM